jgi:uncharacterized protein (TIGR02996 family)
VSTLPEALEATQTALAHRDLESAVEHAVRAWQASRAPELAALVQALDLHLPAVIADHAMELDRDARWTRLARTLRVGQLGGLFQTVRARTWRNTVERLYELASRGPDPRLADALVRLLDDLHHTTIASRDLRSAVFDLMRQMRDPRHLGLDHRALAAVDGRWREVHQELERAEPPASLTEEQRAAIGAMCLALERADPQEDLLQAVWSSPDEDGPRLVYADWLVERGDPRGQFIHLQMLPSPTSAQKRLAQRLLREHMPGWLGPLVPACAAQARFERGFPAAVTLQWASRREVEQLGGHPAWSTVSEVTFADRTHLHEREREHMTQFLGPSLRSLRIVRNVGQGGLSWLGEREELRGVETLTGSSGRVETEVMTQLAATSLPGLRHLGLGWAPVSLFHTLLRSALCKQLQILMFSTYCAEEQELRSLFEAARALPALTWLEMSGNGERVCWQRQGEVETVELSGQALDEGQPFRWALEALAGFEGEISLVEPSRVAPGLVRTLGLRLQLVAKRAERRAPWYPWRPPW